MILNSPLQQKNDLDSSVCSAFSENSSLIIRRGSEDQVVLKKSYSETVEIALLTLNYDKQNRKLSISSQEGSQGAFEDQLSNYNNNKLYIPGISELFKSVNTKFMKLFGEEVFLETSSQLQVLSNNDQMTAKIILTNYRILFVPSDQSYLKNKNLRSDYFSIPISMINHFHKGLEKKNQSPNTLYISTKVGHKFRLIFISENAYDFVMISDVLSKMLPFINVTSHFAFSFHAEYPHLESAMKGWSIYSIDKEFQRQGIILENEFNNTDTLSNADRYAFKKIQNRLSDDTGRICDTYPSEIIVPQALSVEEIIKSSKFRTKNRFPALAYCFRPPYVGKMSTVWRSSQCRHGLGFYNHRSEEDEMYLRLIGNPSNRELQKEDEITVHIYDARPYLNAVANKMNGKGYENVAYYKNTEIFFLKIDNIHVVRDNHRKLIHAASDLTTDKWAYTHEQNGWLIAIGLILTGAKTIIEHSLKKGINVLIHCSDGWDRTTQLVSLVQIMLDPYYRTIEGFEVLVEKDWVSFGHMFKTRNGWKSTNSFEEDKRSPIFIQFLDCVHQLVTQYPFEFEFNLRFLTDLAYYSRTGLFGNFLCDNDMEMEQHQIREKTTSIWSFINSNKGVYTSCLQAGLEDNVNHFKKQISPSTSFVHLRFWKEFFCFNHAKSVERPFVKNVEMNSETDIYEAALRYQISKNEQLKKDNEVLMQRIRELSALNESEISLEQGRKAKSSPKKRTSKDENEFLVVNEEEGEEEFFEGVEM